MTAWQPRPASVDDCDRICRLKRRIILNTFTFLSPREREEEALAASRVCMLGELQKNSFWICEKDGALWALAGLKRLTPEEGLLYSSYSRGCGAGAALLKKRIEAAREWGIQRLEARVFEQNIWSAKHLARQGFIRTDKYHESFGQRVFYWELSTAAGTNQA